MTRIAVLIPLTLLGMAGWFTYRYPVKILDFVFGKDPAQWRPTWFLKIFGIVVMCLAGLSAIMAFASAVPEGSGMKKGPQSLPYYRSAAGTQESRARRYR